MGIFDTIKSRLSGGDQGEYDDEYYDEEEYYGDEQEEAYDDKYYDDVGNNSTSSRGRKQGAFNDYTPLVSMSDVRSQELPRYTPSQSSARTGQSSSQIRTSLPFVREAEDISQRSKEGDPSNYNTGPLNTFESGTTAAYTADENADPLLQRHSLSNTGDFSTTSPAYYASRSGVGHVRQAGQARRVQKFREAVVVNPEIYAESELVAVNLRKGNAVILVLTQTRPELAKRILDFSFGAAAVAEGQVTSIGERIYALTCDYPLTETEMELLHARGVL